MTTAAVAALSFVAVGLSAGIAAEVFGHGGRASGLAIRTTAALNEAAHERQAPGTQETDRPVRDILARPIFSPGRRPAGSAAHSVAGLSRLTGIIVAGPRKVAIFAAAAAGGAPVLVEEGSQINAYRVTAISQTDVTVTGPNGTLVITPIFDQARPAAPVVPALPRPDLSKPPKKSS